MGLSIEDVILKAIQLAEENKLEDSIIPENSKKRNKGA